MKILLTGAEGQVGSALRRALPALGEVIATDRATLDLGDFDAVRRTLREMKPQLIVNPAGFTAVDKAEAEPQLAMRINGLAPGVLGEEAKRLGALLVHYSSDYVFDGEKRSPYTEHDAAKPLGQYGRSKLEGERTIADTGCRHLTLRTSWVYGPHATNFYQFIHRKASASEPFQMVDDQTSVPTPSVFLAQMTVELIRKEAAGLLHLVPCGQATRYDFALEVVRVMGSKSKVTPAKSADFPAPARRPMYSVMDNRRAARALGRLPDWREALAQTLP